MGEGKDVVQCLFVVEQHKRVHSVGAPGVRAGGLALVFVDINPAVGKGVLEVLNILFTQGLEVLNHDLAGGFIIHAHVHIGHNRDIDIIEMQLVHTQRLLAQRQIAVHGGQVTVHRLDQRVIDAFGNLVFKQAHLPRAGITARPCKEGVLLDRSGVGRGNGVGKLVILFVIGFVSITAHAAILALQQRDESAAGQGHGLAVLALDLTEGKVRIGEHGIDGVGRAGHLACLSQQLFLFRRKRMRFQAQHAFQLAAIALQLRQFGKELFHLLMTDADQFRIEERGGGHQLHQQRLCAIRQRLIGGVAVVLIAAHPRIAVQTDANETCFLLTGAGSQKTLRRIHGARAFRNARNQAARLGIVLFPLFIVGVDIFQFPLPAGIHFRSYSIFHFQAHLIFD